MSESPAPKEGGMPLSEHLADLRKRLMVSFGAIIAAFFVMFNYSEYLLELAILPMKKDLVFSLDAPYAYFADRPGQMPDLIFLGPAEGFWMHMKLSLIAGFILVLPVIVHQIWLFISPGLLPKERKFAGPFVIIVSLLFVVGALFCFLIVLPFAMKFLLTYKTENLKPMISIGQYVDFCTKFVLAFGAVFELPVVIVAFTRMGFVTPETLAKHRKYAVLVAFIAAAILTPTPDMFNQTLMAVPIIVLYEAGLQVSKVFVKRRDTKDDDTGQKP